MGEGKGNGGLQQEDAKHCGATERTSMALSLLPLSLATLTCPHFDLDYLDARGWRPIPHACVSPQVLTHNRCILQTVHTRAPTLTTMFFALHLARFLTAQSPARNLPFPPGPCAGRHPRPRHCRHDCPRARPAPPAVLLPE